MSTVKYKLQIQVPGSKASFELTYVDGYFKGLKLLSGKLTQAKHESLLKLAPQFEKVILLLQQEYGDKGISWNQVSIKSDSLFSRLLRAYCMWYETQFGIKAKLSGIETNALKSIVNHLLDCSKDEAEAYDVFLNVLSGWNNLPAFYQKQTELRQINSYLNVLLREAGSIQAAETLDDKFKSMING